MVNQRVTRLLFAAIIVAVCVLGLNAGSEIDVLQRRKEIGQLLSPNEDQRGDALEALTGQYTVSRMEIQTLLADAVQNHRNEQTYRSPLHCAIQSVGVWRVYEAEDMLLTLIDYELDTTQLSMGPEMVEGGSFPAAVALVRVKVDITKILDAIKLAKSMREVQVLTWILSRCLGTTGNAKAFLESEAAAVAVDQPNNIQEAIKILAATLESGDLLPTNRHK